jgi:hypothetical protein
MGSQGRRKTAPQDNARKEAAKASEAGAAAVHVAGIDGKQHRQGDSGRTCVFKDVMGCTAVHPPWLCKVFGRLPAGEREKLIMDNQLCPFCLLHDKDKPCGAKQRPVSVACKASICKGRHIQKLHDFLKDVFREENRVHVVHGSDGWEELDEAWELGEEEMMIVGTVQQEDDCSWQDACNTWVEQEEEATAGVHQVRADQEAAVGQCKKADAAGGGRRISWIRRSAVGEGGTRILPRAVDEESIAGTTQARLADRKQDYLYQEQEEQKQGKEGP